MLKSLILSNFDVERRVNIPVMINYVPVIKISRRPLYYCIFYRNERLLFGYTYYRNFKELVTETSSMSELNELILNNTIVKQLGLSIDEVPDELSSMIDDREIVDIQIISNKSGYRTRALNFITSDYSAYMKLCRNFSNIQDDYPSLASKMAKYNIMLQTAIDSYVYFVSSTSQFLTEYTKLNNTVISGVNINSQSVLRTSYNSAKNTDINNVDNRIIELDNGTTLQISVPIEDEVLGIAEVDRDCQEPLVLQESKLRYNVVGLLLLSEDFGDGKISGIKTFKQIDNPYFEALMVNNNLYSGIILDNKDLIYNRRFKPSIISGDIETYELDDGGELSFKEVLDRL